MKIAWPLLCLGYEQNTSGFARLAVYNAKTLHPRNKDPVSRKVKTPNLFRGHGADDVGVAGVSNAQTTDSEVLAASGAQVNVVTAVMVHASLGKHGIVLDFGLAKRRTVVGDDDQLTLAAAQRLERSSIAQRVFAGLHHQRQPVVNTLLRLLGLLHGHHGCCWRAPIELRDHSGYNACSRWRRCEKKEERTNNCKRIEICTHLDFRVLDAFRGPVPGPVFYRTSGVVPFSSAFPTT